LRVTEIVLVNFAAWLENVISVMEPSCALSTLTWYSEYGDSESINVPSQRFFSTLTHVISEIGITAPAAEVTEMESTFPL